MSPHRGQHGPTAGSRALALALALAAAALAPTPGCRSGERGADAPDRPADAAADARADRPRRAADSGLEAEVLTVSAVGAPVRSVLAPHALDPSGIAAEDLERWRDAGLRVVEVPEDVARALADTAPHTAPIHRVWLGQPTQWNGLMARDIPPPAVRGPFTPTSGLSSVALSVRAWFEPGPYVDTVLRVELAVGGRTARGSAGVVDGLFLSRPLERGRALVILPAPPSEPWLAEPGTEPDAGPRGPDTPGPAVQPPAADPKGPGSGVAPLPPPREFDDRGPTEDGAEADPAPEAAGPEPGEGSEARRTIGERLLIEPAVLTPRPRPARRRVIVLLPVWP